VAEVTARRDASAGGTMAIGHLVVATTIDAATTTGDRDATDAADTTTSQHAETAMAETTAKQRAADTNVGRRPGGSRDQPRLTPERRKGPTR